MRLSIKVLLVFAFAVIYCKSQAQQTLTIDSILLKIESSYPELKMYEAKVSALDAYAEGARSWEAPKLSAGMWMVPYKTGYWQRQRDNMGNTNNGIGQFMLSFEQMIPNRGKLIARENYMKGMSATENESKNFLKNRLFYEAKINFYEWLIIKKKVSILYESEKLLDFIIQSAKLRYTYNKEKISTVYKAEAQLAELQINILAFETEIRKKNIVLNTLLHQDKNLVFDIDTTYKYYAYEFAQHDGNEILAARSDIKSLEQSLKVAKLNLVMEKTKSRPDFGIRYDHMFAFGGQPNLFTLMGTVTLPIVPWSSREYKANIKALEFEIKALGAQKQTILNESSGKLKEFSTNLKNYKLQIGTYERTIIPALRNNYKSTLFAYEQNTENLFVVLDALQALKIARMESLNRVQELLKLQVEYEREIQK